MAGVSSIQPCNTRSGEFDQILDIILGSAFLFGIGFAFGAAASSSVEVEMVSKDELSSAVTLGGLRMNIAGIIGPLLGGLLIPIVGTSLIFGVNGLGFLFQFLATLRWKRAQTPTPLGSEHFLATITSAIRYVQYTPGIRVILARIAMFTFYISTISVLMPVVGLEVMKLEPTDLGYFFTALAWSQSSELCSSSPWLALAFPRTR